MINNLKIRTMKNNKMISAPTVGLYLSCFAGVLGYYGITSCSESQKIVNEESKEKRPLNIVYIMSDDHARQMISCYDQRHIQTPNIDRIAEGGVRFSNAFVANSISGPSRACLLTGKHSHKNGKLDNHTSFDGSQQTVQELLRNGGYQTAMIGKWHLDSEPTNFNHWEILPGQGSYYNPDFITPEGKKRYAGYATTITTDLALEWLENGRDKAKPFCLFLHHKAPHRNWMADTAYLSLYEDKIFDVPSNFFDDYSGRVAAAQQEMSIASDHDMDIVNDLKMVRPGVKTRLSDAYIYGEYARLDSDQKSKWDAHYQPIIDSFYAANLSGKELALWKYQRYMRDYSKVIKNLDDNIGRLLDYLEEHDMLENTIIIYTSDQGFYMGEHGWFDKRFMYEESFSTPLVMHLPKEFVKHGEIKALVQNIDFAPTMLAIAGVPIPEDIQGVSLLPLLQNEKTPSGWRKSLYYHYYEYPAEHAVKRHYGVRTTKYKLIHFYNDIDTWELYDIKRDPKEMNNLFGEPKYKNLTKKLKSELLRLQEVYDDPIRNSE